MKLTSFWKKDEVERNNDPQRVALPVEERKCMSPNIFKAASLLFGLAVASHAWKSGEGKKAPECDSTRILQPSDHSMIVIDPVLESDTLAKTPPLKTKSREFLAYEDEVFQYYIGKRGKEIRHGLYQIVGKGDNAGKVVESGSYSHNKRVGRWTSWYLTGQIKTESEYKNGKLNGKMITYHPNGVIFEQQEFRDGKTNCEDDHAIGYHANGRLKFEIQIRNGLIVMDVRFDTLGLPVPQHSP
jgi:hypothetical protein